MENRRLNIPGKKKDPNTTDQPQSSKPLSWRLRALLNQRKRVRPTR